MAKTNSEMSTPEYPHNGTMAETENLNSVYEFREALWETDIRPMRSPLHAQMRPEAGWTAAEANELEQIDRSSGQSDKD